MINSKYYSMRSVTEMLHGRKTKDLTDFLKGERLDLYTNLAVIQKCGTPEEIEEAQRQLADYDKALDNFLCRIEDLEKAFHGLGSMLRGDIRHESTNNLFTDCD